MLVFRIKRYSAVDLIAGFPRWEYFAEKDVRTARELRDTTYHYDVVYGMAHRRGKLQVYWERKWVTVKDRDPQFWIDYEEDLAYYVKKSGSGEGT